MNSQELKQASNGTRTRSLRSSGALFLPFAAAAVLVVIAAFSAGRSSPQPIWAGMEIEPLTPDLSAALGLPRDQAGVFVSDVVGAALQAGVQEGDVIVAVNGAPVPDTRAFQDAIGEIQGPARLDVIRQGVMQSFLVYPAEGAGQVVPVGLATAPGTLPPACATCPGRPGCFPPAAAAATPAAFPAGCAGCPLGPGPGPGPGPGFGPGPPLMPGPGASVAPYQPVALPCYGGTCPLP